MASHTMEKNTVDVNSPRKVTPLLENTKRLSLQRNIKISVTYTVNSLCMYTLLILLVSLSHENVG